MSLRPSTRMATSLLRTRPTPLSVSRSAVVAFTRSYSDDAPPPPPLLQKLKSDLKTAMREKNAARLSVLRSILAATVNASKTSSPITTDVALVALLRKQIRTSTEARDEFAAAGRADLVATEAAQLAVLGEYVSGSGVEVLGKEQLQALIRQAVASLGEKPKLGDVMKTLLAPEGPLSGKSFDKAELMILVKETVAA